MLQQQKDRFKNKYKEKGLALLEKNKSLDNIEQIPSDGNGGREESFHLDPLITTNKASFAKTKMLEDAHIEQWIEKRKSLGTVTHMKRKKKIRPKERLDSR